MQVERSQSPNSLPEKVSAYLYDSAQHVSSLFRPGEKATKLSATGSEAIRVDRARANQAAVSATATADDVGSTSANANLATTATAAAAIISDTSHLCDPHTGLKVPLPPQRLVEDKSWRCDLHPAWSHDYQSVVINGRPDGAERQVILLHLGPDLSVYFPPLAENASRPHGDLL